MLAHIARYNELYYFALKKALKNVCVVLLGVMLPLRHHSSTMLVALARWEEASDLVGQASIYEWTIDNAADDGDGAPAA